MRSFKYLFSSIGEYGNTQDDLIMNVGEGLKAFRAMNMCNVISVTLDVKKGLHEKVVEPMVMYGVDGGVKLSV